MSSSTLSGAPPQTNGVPPSSQPGEFSQPLQPSQSQGSTTQPNTTQPTQQSASAAHFHPHQADQAPTSPTTASTRPRDQRIIELLLTAQGVTAFEQRVPLLLMDFAYRHTSSVLTDALHLSADPYTSQAGAKPSATSGAAPVNPGDATITANAVQLAIASRLGFQFRGGGGGAGGGTSKDWLMDLAAERNKVALQRVAPAEWGVRLPSERFVLSGVSWGLKEVWAGPEGEDEEDEEEEDEEMPEMNLSSGVAGASGAADDAMEGVETEDVGEGVEGGTAADIFGDDLEDEEMMEE